MYRNELEQKTGLTRRAIEYYEKKKIINPIRDENGYRNYNDNDIEILCKVNTFKKLGFTINEIIDVLKNNKYLNDIIKDKRRKLNFDVKKQEILEMFYEEKYDFNCINDKLKVIEKEEKIYERLNYIFPDSIAKIIFYSYKPFFDEKIVDGGEKYFEEYVDYINSLPPFEMDEIEKEHFEKAMYKMEESEVENIISNRINAVNNFDEWFDENKDNINLYLEYKKSEEYDKSLAKKINDSLKDYMQKIKYYEIAIPLIRKFSKSYDEYYIKLLETNEKLLKKCKL